MGIATVVAAALKHVSWGKVADFALRHGPDLVKKFKERQQGGPVAGTDEVDVVTERVRELENLLIQHEQTIARMHEEITALEQTGKRMQARLRISVVVSVVLGLMLLAAVIRYA